ncbi:MAG: amidoligase family protein [Sandaracinaceae bacterium]|nr:amidoligase family protein [Sandaracinaceae bacterium]
MKTLRFGIEIETVGLSRQALAQAIHSGVGGTLSSFDTFVRDPQGRTWSVVHDGSLSGGSHRSGEIVSPVLTYDDLPVLQEVVRAVRRAGARVDTSCGIHVHIDGARFDVKAVMNLVKMMHKQERLIEKALGVQQARLGSYCRPIDEAFLRRLEQRPPRTMQELRDAWYGRPNARAQRYDATRYRGLNLNSLFFRGTIEIRAFEGTLHAGEVKSNVQFALALAAKALRAKTASSKRRDSRTDATKYEFRVFLVSGLGLIGEEFKTARLHLTKRLAGSAAWRGERRDRRPTSQPTPGADAAQ